METQLLKLQTTKLSKAFPLHSITHIKNTLSLNFTIIHTFLLPSLPTYLSRSLSRITNHTVRSCTHALSSLHLPFPPRPPFPRPVSSLAPQNFCALRISPLLKKREYVRILCSGLATVPLRTAWLLFALKDLSKSPSSLAPNGEHKI
jgi:hypothetical protein